MATQYQTIMQIRDNLQNALLQDSINPAPSYSVGGQSVNRESWRESLLKQIMELNKLASMIQPTEFRTQIY